MPRKLVKQLNFILKTKLLLFFVGAFLITSNLKAQHVVRLSPLAFIKNKAKIHYEYGTGKIGIGVIAAGYFGAYPGVRFQPYFRYYITDDALNGLYVQPKFHFSMNSYETQSTTDPNPNETIKNDINEFGGALNLGWQFLLGNNENIVLDLFTGYRFSNLHGKKYDDNLSNVEDLLSEGLYTILHSNKFDLGVSIGFKF